MGFLIGIFLLHYICESFSIDALHSFNLTATPDSLE